MTRTILLADDSVTIQKVVELTFLEEDLNVVAVGTGDEALARLDDLTPALVIADVHMPGADGFEVCRRVKQRDPSIPVLLLVGTFEPFEADAVEAAGAQGHLKKPFDSQELRRVALDLIGDPEPSDSEGAAESHVAAMFESDPVPSEPAGEPPAAPEARSEATSAAAPAGDTLTTEASTSDIESGPNGRLPDEDVERIARRVVELLSDKAIREVAWEVVPDLAELIIRDRLRELESQVE